MKNIIRCDRCQKRYRGHGDWNMTVRRGVIVGMDCPDCQTPMENAKAEINLATLDYGVSADGLLVGGPKWTTA